MTYDDRGLPTREVLDKDGVGNQVQPTTEEYSYDGDRLVVDKLTTSTPSESYEMDFSFDCSAPRRVASR